MVDHPDQDRGDLRDPGAAHALQHLVRAACGGPDAAPHRPQRERALRPAPVARRRREAGAQGGPHPHGRRQGGLPPGADHRDGAGVLDLRGDPVRPRGQHVRRGDAAAAHRHAGGRAVRDGGRLDRHLRDRARRLVQRLDVLPARRPPLERADDLLRGRDGARAGGGVPLRRLAVDLRDRRVPGRLLVRPDPGAFVRHLRDLDDRGDQPRAVRPPRGGGRAGRGLPHRVQLAEVRAVLPRRVHQHGDGRGARDDAVPRRVARALLDRPHLARRQRGLCASHLVLRQGLRLHLLLHLAAGHPAADALRPVHGAGVEGADPELADLDRGGRHDPRGLARGRHRPPVPPDGHRCRPGPAARTLLLAGR